MSAAKLYRVRWEREAPRGRETQTRLFRQRAAAVRWLLTMRREGHRAELYSAPAPEWETEVVPTVELKRHTAFVRRRVRFRQAAREKWSAS